MTDSDHTFESYRAAFSRAELATQYDESQYAPESWSSLLWVVERRILEYLLHREGLVKTRERYLDFACGTGRVTGFLAPLFDTTVGVDISEPMLEVARAQLPNATFVKADVREAQVELGGPFDLITAFRFLLNADLD